MDRSKYTNSAFKSNKSVESNAVRLCYDIEAYFQDHENPKVLKSLQKYIDRTLSILKGEHKLSKSENMKEKFGRVSKSYCIIEFVLVNITVFSLEMAKELFLIFFLCLDHVLVSYFVENSENLAKLLITPVSSLNLDLLCGQFFRDLIQNPEIFKAFLTVEVFNGLIEGACNQMFEIQSDALVSIRALLTQEESYEFVNKNSFDVLKGLYKCCDVNYYVTRSSLNLLYILLCDRMNQVFIYHFIENIENLKYAMNLMKEDTHIEIKTEAFFIFCQVSRVVFGRIDKEKLAAFKIIKRNKNHLLKYLGKFQLYREDDLFQSEKSNIIQILESIEN
jgi:hypothetical protein